ncbi:endolytic transglycosylase MltG [Candidatus Caldatribacterium sp.]|uniref:endolytic transglycosylase MltG n=1 Tax=Candidatus Caldatribacterium sp. TaxID=2282143 RepID=UPI00299C3402|nr:endolytic transglycosylase MltG [Candidatus Caldatribacterium sp.]MDW8081698.1 endolytic transglycosylase MltG [Candidatus Calescibacterium sp.]
MKSWGIFVLALLYLLAVFGYLAFFFDLPFGEPKLVAIPRGTPLSGIARILEQEGITSRFRFLAFALLSKRTPLLAGWYRLTPGMSPARLVDILSQGPPRVRVTFPEGCTAEDMARILEALGVCGAKEYLTFVEHPEYFQKPWLAQVPTLEGFLFPDTYFFQVPTPPQEVINVQLARFEELVLPLFAGKEDKLRETLTLASIVEKETRLEEEKPLVASVFRNRLKENMRLQSCATVVYALKRERGITVYTLREEDLGVDSPFNTYRVSGLPPHPICNPGLSSIRAALEPAETDYLFFVLQDDGRHAFARTYEEHLRNKRGNP